MLAKGFETENSSITTVAELTKPVETIFHVRNDGQRKTPGPFLVEGIAVNATTSHKLDTCVFPYQRVAGE